MIDFSKWSSNLAYAIGLIATDGNLSVDGRHMELTSKDIEQLENFKKCLEIDPRLGWKTSGFSEKKYPRIQFGNVKFYRWLQSIGLTPHKSHTIKELAIPSEYFFDWLRGSFDGDGYIYAYWDKRWKSSYMFYVIFLSASREHIMWINRMIAKELGFEGKIGKNVTVYKLIFAKEKSLKIIGKMYRKDCTCLTRKRDKVKRILEINGTPGW